MPSIRVLLLCLKKVSRADSMDGGGDFNLEFVVWLLRCKIQFRKFGISNLPKSFLFACLSLNS